MIRAVRSATLGGLVALATLAAGLVPGVAVPPAASQVRAATAADPRPNVVVVMMDDLRWDELRFAPHVTRHLTQRGLRFANSFSPLPLCCPARASFLLGQYAHNHRVLTVHAPYGFGALDDSRTLATALRGAGYRTGMVGKYLNGYGQMPSLVTGKASMTYRPAGWTSWMASLETRWPRGSKYSGGTYNYMSLTQNINGRVAMNRGKYSSAVIADQAAALVRSYRGATPFFLWLNPVAPHVGSPSEKRDPRNARRDGRVLEFKTPYVPSRLHGRFDKVITRAPGLPAGPAEADVSDKPERIRRLVELNAVERQRLRDVERQRAESIFAWDQQFAKVIAELQRTGEYDETVLMLTSDNGYFLGEHRMHAGKGLHYEPSSRVPFVVAGPGVQRGVRQAPIATHDLTATILDIAGAEPLPAMDGLSLWPVMTGPDAPWTRPIVIEAATATRRTDPDFPEGLGQVAVRTGRWKYVRWANAEEELYDLREDPNELTSLHASPEHAEIKARLIEVWSRRAECRAQECTAPLPDDLHVDVATLAAQERGAEAAKRAYYGR